MKPWLPPALKRAWAVWCLRGRIAGWGRSLFEAARPSFCVCVTRNCTTLLLSPGAHECWRQIEVVFTCTRVVLTARREAALCRQSVTQRR